MRKILTADVIGTLFPGIQGAVPVIADNGSMPDQISLINAILSQNPWQAAVYNAATNTASFTATQSQIMGAEETVLALTGIAGAGVALTLPTAAVMQATMTPTQAVVGSTTLLRIINVATTQTVTVTTASGWTLNGTMTIATATWRDFIISISAVGASPAMAIQNIGGGNIV